MDTNDELNPLTLGDTPEEFIENDDGSVEIPLEGEVDDVVSEFTQNIAVILTDSELNDISGELIELIEKDKQAREKRDKQYEEGLRRTGLGDDAPGGAEFEGASKVVHPVLAEACVDFSARAIKELFPASGPVKPWVIGETTTKKLEKANRKSRFMNWQLTTQIEEYRSELEQLLTQLPMGGSQYQKFWYDERLGRTRSEFIPVDEVFLPYSATSFYTANRITHRQPITRFEFERRVKSGLYRDVSLPDPNSIPEQSASAIANDKIEGRETDAYDEDGLRAVLEIYTWQQIEADDFSEGEYAPYIITIDEYTEEVLAVYRNWKEDDIKLRKLEWLVEWKFIPWRGAYAIGLPHLIGGISAALTGSLRALLDSAHINNAATMLKLKSGRMVGQNTQVNVTQVHEIEGPAGIDDVRKLAMPMPFNPPSPVLAQLMDKLYELAKGVVSSADDSLNQVGDRTPVGTTMALIEQGSTTYSAIHARLHESQKKALAILHRINGVYLDDEEVVEELGELVVSRTDFHGPMDVIPVSDPTIFSEAQRFAQSQSIMQMAMGDVQNPNIRWNQTAVRRRVLKQMRIENIDEILPPEKDPVTSNILEENLKFSEGHPLKASDEQDHFAHMNGHLSWLESPLVIMNPLIQIPVLTNMLLHVNEHIQMIQANVIRQAADQFGGGDQGVAMAYQQVMPQVVEMLTPILNRVGNMQKMIQSKMPPPQMPPEIQASIQIAKMETDRKTQLDQATLAMKQQENMSDAQLEQTRLGMEQARQQFQQMLDAQEAQNTQRNHEMRGHLEMLRNEQDNHQKQMTELLKNRDDNDTKKVIEEMKLQMDQMVQQSSQQPQPDVSGQLAQLQSVLDQMGKQQTSEALSSVMEGLRATIEHLGRPKMLIKDEQGKTIGVQSA